MEGQDQSAQSNPASSGDEGSGGSAVLEGPTAGRCSDVCLVPIEALRLADSPRIEGEDEQHIEVLAQVETELPPILVHRSSMRVIDGMHRLRAATLRSQKSIAVRFFDGSEIEAFVLAVEANRAHGLPLSLPDRQAAAARILAAQPYTSDRSVAGITGLSTRTVSALRARLNPNHEEVPRIGRDGRLRPVNGAEGRRIASEVIAIRPDASLREIAKAASISPATARDVRERMRRGEDPIPASQRKSQERDRSGPTRIGASRYSEARPLGRDRAELLRNLNQDPSLRFRESGRSVLRWLHTRANGLDGWEEIADSIPPHCAHLVTEVAHSCADEWLAFARALEKAIASSA